MYMKPLLISLALFSALSFANTPLPDHRHIAITGQAEITAKPDSAILHLVVEDTQKQSKDAKAAVDKRFNQLVSKLEKFNITKSDFVASKLSTSPHHNYSRQQNEHVLVGYKARRTIEVTVKNLDNLSEIMDQVLDVKINQIRNIELINSNAEQLQQTALTAAIKDAKNNGAALAEAFNATLGKIYSINARNNERLYESSARMQMISAETGNAVSPGMYLQDKLTFKATIDVVFDLEVNGSNK